jgi:hypothetical protein
MAEQEQGPGESWSPLYALFEGDLPSQLADLRSLEADFTFARNCAGAYLNADKLSGGDEESMKVIRQGLWRSAVISYRRGFTGGKAHLVPQGRRLQVPDHWTDLLNPEQLEAHNQLLHLADKHVAHQTGEREHMRVAAMLTPPPMPRALAGITVFSIERSPPQDDLVIRLGQLCTILVKILKDRSEELGDAFMEHVKAQELDDLYKNSRPDLIVLKVEPPKE